MRQSSVTDTATVARVDTIVTPYLNYLADLVLSCIPHLKAKNTTTYPIASSVVYRACRVTQFVPVIYRIDLVSERYGFTYYGPFANELLLEHS